MKKIICILCCVFLVCGCSFGSEQGEPIELTPREALNKLQNEKENSFMLYITTENCYTCEEYRSVVEEIQESMPFDIYYITLDMDVKDSTTKADLEELNVTIGDYQSLPTTYYFYQGTLLPENKRDGYIEKADFITWLKALRILQ